MRFLMTINRNGATAVHGKWRSYIYIVASVAVASAVIQLVGMWLNSSWINIILIPAHHTSEATHWHVALVTGL